MPTLRLLFLTAAVIACLGATSSAVASAATVNCSVSGSFERNGAIVRNGSLCVGAAVIPPNVAQIDENAFAGATGLTRVTMPEDVRIISPHAFQDTTALTSVSLPAGLTTIGDYAFYGSALTSITIPDGITAIAPYSFGIMPSLTSVNLPAGLTTIDESAFVNSGVTSVTIPDGVTTIAAHAFSGAANLTSVSFPASLTTLGDDSFSSVPLLARVVFRGNAPQNVYGPHVFGGVSATAYRLPGTTGWGSGATWTGLTLAYFLPAPAAPTAVAGLAGGTATVTVTAAGYGPAPDSLVVTAVEDPTRTCTVAGATGGFCTITGLTGGASYTFTAVARNAAAGAIPAVTSDTSDASNAVVPTAPPAPPASPATTTTTRTTPPAPNLPIAGSAASATTLRTTFMATGPGTAVQIATTPSGRRSNTVRVCSVRVEVTHAGPATITCPLTTAARRMRLERPLVVTVTTTFTPQGGTALTSTRTIRLARIVAPVVEHPVPSAVTG